MGNVLSFAITASLAARTGASILLRIDDMDQDRVRREYVQDIFDTLTFLHIPWQEGPRNYEDYEANWSQLHRLPLYHQALQQLWDSGQVYACTCSRSQIMAAHPDGIYTGTCRHKNLAPDTPDACWRLRTEPVAEIHMKTLTGTELHLLPADMADFVIRKKDGLPAYQLSSVVDDTHYGIDFIVRGADLLHSTIAQLYLAHILGNTTFYGTTFFHHPLATDAAGRKLSKSAGDTSIQHLRSVYNTAESVYTAIGQSIGLTAHATSYEQLAFPWLPALS